MVRALEQRETKQTHTALVRRVRRKHRGGMARSEGKGNHAFAAVATVQAVVKVVCTRTVAGTVDAHPLGAGIVYHTRGLSNPTGSTAVSRSAIVLDRGVPVLEAGQPNNNKNEQSQTTCNLWHCKKR